MMKKIIYWLPRILAILFIAFLSIFALDVFGQPQWFFALLMHLIPSFILIALTIVAWKRAFLGGLLFLVAGLLMFGYFRSLTIAVPVVIIGCLFLIGKGSPETRHQKLKI